MSQSPSSSPSLSQSPPSNNAPANDAADSPAPDPAAPTRTASLEDHLERLTSAVHATGHEVHVCCATCAERCALAQARDARDSERALSVQEQLARLLGMTQETVRTMREERVTADPQKYARDLQRAAFGAGGTPETISRSSMMDSTEL